LDLFDEFSQFLLSFLFLFEEVDGWVKINVSVINYAINLVHIIIINLVNIAIIRLDVRMAHIVVMYWTHLTVAVRVGLGLS